MIKRNELTLQTEEQSKQIESLQAEVKKLKIHKKVLKEEVISLRSQLHDFELKASSKTQALKNLGEFFRKQTEGLMSLHETETNRSRSNRSGNLSASISSEANDEESKSSLSYN